jgi:hypothetical protein
MPIGYMLKKQNDTYATLDRVVKRFLRSQGAELAQNIENAGISVSVYEIKDCGAIFYIAAEDGRDMTVRTKGKLVDHAIAQLSLLGFDQKSAAFETLKQNLETALKKYIA